MSKDIGYLNKILGINLTYENAEKDMAKMNMNIGEIVNLIQEISEQSYYYKPIANNIIAKTASENEVEHLLDYMLGVCLDDRMLNLFKKVCRRYYNLYPEMIAFEILTYRELYDD